MLKATVVFLSALLLIGGMAQADTVTFDLEDLAPGGILPGGGAVTTSTMFMGQTISLKISYSESYPAIPPPFVTPNSELEVVDISGFLGGPNPWGNRSLSFFSIPGTVNAFKDFINIEVNLGTLAGYVVSGIGWDMGDVFGTDIDTWTIRTFSGATEVLSPDYPQSPLTFLGPNNFAYSTESVERASSITSAKLSAGSPEYPNSIYFDNLTLQLTQSGGSDIPGTDFGGGSGGTGPASGSGQIPITSTVPLPAGVWLGMVMLGGLGVIRRIRRRRE